jgi:hypothetical protein
MEYYEIEATETCNGETKNRTVFVCGNWYAIKGGMRANYSPSQSLLFDGCDLDEIKDTDCHELCGETFETVYDLLDAIDEMIEDHLEE